MTTEEIQARYNHLADKARKMLTAQRAYFKSNKDFQLLKKSKALESEVRGLCNPPKTQQQSIFTEEFLGR